MAIWKYNKIFQEVVKSYLIAQLSNNALATEVDPEF